MHKHSKSPAAEPECWTIYEYYIGRWAYPAWQAICEWNYRVWVKVTGRWYCYHCDTYHRRRVKRHIRWNKDRMHHEMVCSLATAPDTTAPSVPATHSIYTED